ncbi:hypothetical protein I4641_00715 [Waterburya agarophytonicola K14]|uniref:Uncharacterized protein n=1 Tax=Waterburya agarophytonicola KI4 TaxID=2874699 RepID=A0A964BLC1_9CYAN|nr:hypothetical protein [Waterburya agarophytonicola]MCC0175503.1 hypothetical protein [Waterburya agarophytonicola KI4]
MKAESVIEILQTNPQSWRIAFQNSESIVFAWGDYRFTRLSDRFNCVMMLNSKYDRVKINWAVDDPMIDKFYAGLIRQHLRG